MRSLINTFLVILLLGAQTGAAGDHDLAGSPSILVLGDSLSAAFGIAEEESWVALLGEQLQAEGYGYRVINASISGETTTGGLRRIAGALEQHQPAVVILELGGNDGLRGTSLGIIRSNLASMIELSQAAGARVVLAGMMMPPNYGPYADRFAAIYPELAQEFGIGLVSFFLEGVALDMSLFLADGIHPSAEAQPRLLANVWPVLQPKLRHRAAEMSAR
ncbi:MAG: arylesterase [Chromatiales bacterium]|nr:arylesterase [Chromatiales bacterium]